MELVFSLSREWLPRLHWDVSRSVLGRKGTGREYFWLAVNGTSSQTLATEPIQDAGTTLRLVHTSGEEVSVASRMLVYATDAAQGFSRPN
jgi:hypothetical protein